MEALRFWSELDAGDQPDCRKERESRRSAVTEEGKRQPDDRGDAQTHADVDEALKQQRRGDAETDQHTHGVFRAQADHDAAQNDEQQQYDDAQYHQ